MDEKIAELAVNQAISLGAEWAEARLQSDASFSVSFKNGKIEPPEVERIKGCSIRVIVKGSLGFGSTNGLDRKRVKAIAERAVKGAKGASSLTKEKISLSISKETKASYTSKEKQSFKDVCPSAITSLLKELDSRVARASKQVKFPSRMFTLAHLLTEKLYLNSEGSKVYSLIPRISFYWLCSAHHAQKGIIERSFQLGASKGWEAVEEWNLLNRSESEAKILEKILIKGKRAKTGQMDLVVGPEVAGIIAHESVGHPAEADRILGREAAQAGKSYMEASWIGKQLGSKASAILDDPTLPGSYGFYLWDDEGVKARKRILVEEGKIKEFLHNRETASKFKTLSNGAGRASLYSVEPLIRMANTYFPPGNWTLEELIQGVKQGVYMKNFMEWNIDDKRVNQRYVGLEAYQIENGEILEPIKLPFLEISTFELHKKLDARGKDLAFQAAECGKGDPLQGIPVWVGGPSLRFRGVRIGRR
jgi:TldD protein